MSASSSKSSGSSIFDSSSVPRSSADSSSSLKGGSDGGIGSSSSSSSSCVCDFLIELDLLNDTSYVATFTNMSPCVLTIFSMTYANASGAVTSAVGMPANVPGNGGILTIPCEESFDVRGLSVDVWTSCGDSYFEIPIE